METYSNNTYSSGIYRPSTIEKIKTFKNLLLKMIIWTLVGGAILGALMILLADSAGGEVMAKFMGTLFILAGAALVTVVDFHGIESGDKASQILASMGIVMNICWSVLWILVIWEVFDIWEPFKCAHSSSSISCYGFRTYSILGRITFISTYLSSLGLFGSCAMGLYEGSKKSTIRPLKITSTACLAYTELYAIIIVITDGITFDDAFNRFGVLAGFTSFIWFITLIIATVLSRREKKIIESSERKKQEEKQQQILEKAAGNVAAKPATPKTDEELRAEIEEKVRRELIEKEVREKLEKEMAEKK